MKASLYKNSPVKFSKQSLFFKGVVLFIMLVNVLGGCKNDDDAPTTLPEATQTGAGTFGCLVNGEPFIETGTYFNCYYQYVDGGYYFSINAKSEYNSILQIIHLGSQAMIIQEDGVYSLGCYWSIGDYFGEVIFANSAQETDTCDTEYGYLHITKFDFTNYIVSGTFEFDVLNPYTGEIIEIREGRFDTKFGL